MHLCVYAKSVSVKVESSSLWRNRFHTDMLLSRPRPFQWCLLYWPMKLNLHLSSSHRDVLRPFVGPRWKVAVLYQWVLTWWHTCLLCKLKIGDIRAAAWSGMCASCRGAFFLLFWCFSQDGKWIRKIEWTSPSEGNIILYIYWSL